ncbi:MAG TPA: phosphate ABC transporter substrate-binding protein [Cyanobacteria bacterium UBA8156]|nr:phosphate ABC transporter substrate-binding protein [Cyanobacteria bacterium UBA8156]
MEGKETAVLVGTLLVTLGVAGGGFFLLSSSPKPDAGGTNSANPSVVAPPNNETSSPPATTVKPDGALTGLQATLPNTPVVAMDGSVTMVRLVKQMQNSFSQQNPSIATTYGIPDGRPNGSNKGLQALAEGRVALAATSRPLKADQVAAGLVAIPVARDALAVVVGINNPFKGALTTAQLRGIFNGSITNWNQVGGPNLPIRVLNRANASGTQELFKDVILEGKDFPPNGTNYITWPRDETTPILRELGTNGISYTTVFQARGQSLVRIVPIDGMVPTDVANITNGRYPLSRFLYFAARREVTPNARTFLEFALSPQGQQAVERAEFIPL